VCGGGHEYATHRPGTRAIDFWYTGLYNGDVAVLEYSFEVPVVTLIRQTAEPMDGDYG
jgi:hypothetical protein